MKIQNKTVSFALLGVLATSALGGAFAPVAQAKGSSTWKTGAIVGGVLGGYGLLKKNKTVGLAGVGVGAYSLYRLNKAKRNEKRQSRLFYQRRYGRNWRSHYPS